MYLSEEAKGNIWCSIKCLLAIPLTAPVVAYGLVLFQGNTSPGEKQKFPQTLTTESKLEKLTQTSSRQESGTQPFSDYINRYIH